MKKVNDTDYPQSLGVKAARKLATISLRPNSRRAPGNIADAIGLGAAI